MTHSLRQAALIASIVVFAVAGTRAQDAGGGGQAKPQSQPPSPVQVEVVIARYRGDKKVSSAPYVLSVKPNAGITRGANLRLMTSVPIAVGVEKGLQYRDIGTAIDVSANGPMSDGGYEVTVGISESSLVTDTPLQQSPPSAYSMIRSYSSNNVMLIRDGQTKQYTVATEALSGEVVRVDVTLRLQK